MKESLYNQSINFKIEVIRFVIKEEFAIWGFYPKRVKVKENVK
jgi:hypothetical protein